MHFVSLAHRARADAQPSLRSAVPRWRLGVALLIPDPTAVQIDGLRRALGDKTLGRIPPHVTLVPPVNVAVDRLDTVFALVRKAAAAASPIVLELGPVETFAPATPVIKLRVHGTGIRTLETLRDAIFVGPLERTLQWPFVPHVTLKDEASPAQLEHAATVMPDYCAQVEIDRVHVLREYEGRVWRPIADAAFEQPAVVGRGGVEIEIAVTTIVDPLVAQLLDGMIPICDLVLTARVDDVPVGVAAALVKGDDIQVAALVVRPDVRGRGVGSHLLRHLLAEGASRGAELAVVAFDEPSRDVEDELYGFFARFGFNGGVRPLP